MSLSSNSPVSPSLSVPNAAALAALETAGLPDGELVLKTDDQTIWKLAKTSTTATSASCVATRNSSNGASAGRWKQDTAAEIAFDDTLVSPALGATNVQTAIDALKKGASIKVTNYAALDAVNASLLQDGTRVTLTNQDSQWVLRTEVQVLNTIDTNIARVALTTSGLPKYWERLPIGSQIWWREHIDTDGVIYINSSTGADDNSGNALAPLHSLDEFIRRTQGIALTEFVEIDVAGSALIWTTPLAPIAGMRTASASGSLFISGGVTQVGSAAVTTTAFNRTTGQGQTYAATIAALPLTSYLPSTSTGVYYFLSSSSSSPADGVLGWLLWTASGANVLCPTGDNTGTRSSITNGTTVYLYRPTTVAVYKSVLLDMTQWLNNSVEFDYIAWGGSSSEFKVVGGSNANLFMRACGTNLFNMNGVQRADLENCFFATPQFTDSYTQTFCCTSRDNGMFAVGGKWLSVGDASVQVGGGVEGGANHSFDDLEIRANAGANVAGFTITGTTAYFPTTVWGATIASAAMGVGIQCNNSGAYGNYVTKTNITIDATVLVRLAMPGGNTDAANAAALPIPGAATTKGQAFTN